MNEIRSMNRFCQGFGDADLEVGKAAFHAYASALEKAGDPSGRGQPHP
jgi:hypothetical protein